jgi:hypothetical protein
MENHSQPVLFIIDLKCIVCVLKREIRAAAQNCFFKDCETVNSFADSFFLSRKSEQSSSNESNWESTENQFGKLEATLKI